MMLYEILAELRTLRRRWRREETRLVKWANIRFAEKTVTGEMVGDSYIKQSLGYREAANAVDKIIRKIEGKE